MELDLIKCDLHSVRQTVMQLQSTLLSPESVLHAEQIEPFTDLVSASVAEKSSQTSVLRYESSYVENISLAKEWRAESLASYSLLQCYLGDYENWLRGFEELASRFKITCETTKLDTSFHPKMGDETVGSENTPVRSKNLIEHRTLIGEDLDFTLKLPPSKVANKKADFDRTDVFEAVEEVCRKTEIEKEILLSQLRNLQYDFERAQESLEVSQKTVSYMKTQLETERKRYAYLENSSAEINAVVRGINAKLDCSEPGTSGVQAAKGLSVTVDHLLQTHPWLRNWKKIESSGPKDPFQVLEKKETELQDAARFINELGEELSGVKAERASLREELEGRDNLIQKLRSEAAQNHHQIERYRKMFDSLYDPDTAARFAKKVQEKYARCQSKVSASPSMQSCGNASKRDTPQVVSQSSEHQTSLEKAKPLSRPFSALRESAKNRENADLKPLFCTFQREPKASRNTVSSPIGDLKRIRLGDEPNEVQGITDTGSKMPLTTISPIGDPEPQGAAVGANGPQISTNPASKKPRTVISPTGDPLPVRLDDISPSPIPAKSTSENIDIVKPPKDLMQTQGTEYPLAPATRPSYWPSQNRDPNCPTS